MIVPKKEQLPRSLGKEKWGGSKKIDPIVEGKKILASAKEIHEEVER